MNFECVVDLYKIKALGNLPSGYFHHLYFHFCKVSDKKGGNKIREDEQRAKHPAGLASEALIHSFGADLNILRLHLDH